MKTKITRTKTEPIKSSHLALNFTPSADAFQFLMDELRKEGAENPRCGLHNNINIIEHLYAKNEFVTLIEDNSEIGFCTVSVLSKYVAHIDFIWILPSKRKLGLGIEFQNLINQKLKMDGVKILEIDSVSEGGQALADKIGFLLLDNTPYKFTGFSYSPQSRYLFLDRYRKPTALTDEGTYLMLMRAPRVEEFDCYKLNSGIRSLPILAVVNREANVRVIENGKCVFEGLIKRVFEDNIQSGKYLYLASIPARIKKKLSL